MLKGKKILVTSGGTQEYIDDVRVLTNISSGRLGAIIAETLAYLGEAEVYYLHGKNAVIPENTPSYAHAIECYPVVTAMDAFNTMKNFVPGMDAVVHCMAVSDFTFNRETPTKCKSSSPQAFIDFMRDSIAVNPKIIGKVKEWNPKTILIGFKFEVGLSHEDLIGKAKASIISNFCDAVIANDKEEMTRTKNHIAYMVFPELSAQELVMKGKREIALQIRLFLDQKL